MSEGAGGSRRTKIERVSDAYDLPELESVLVDRWTGEREERWSLRELAAYVNQRLLEAALREAGQQPLDGEVENHYRLLTADDVSAGDRTEAREELERAGVDLDELTSDFVSHQAVHTYLTDRREVQYEHVSEEERRERAVETVGKLESRTATVAENTVAGLREAGTLDLEDFSVLTSVSVVCESCGTQYDLADLVENGGCDCQ